ncbi:MAG: arginine deiminase-related protein [Dokdonella sp.]
MIVDRPEDFVSALASLPSTAFGPATARAAFLVSPIDFSLAGESASDNHYMDLSRHAYPARALAQHAELARALSADVPVVSFPGDAEAPDGVFPNNAFATVPGRLIIGRMRHAVRQRETQRADIRRWFGEIAGYSIVDLSANASVAELTGALVIDRARGIGYCGLSERCDREGARAMHEAFGLRLTFCFELAPGEYHTNVILAVLAGRAALIAADGFADTAVASAIARAYPGRMIALDVEQKNAFAANAITLGSERVWMSARASACLSPAQRLQLAASGFSVGVVELDEIERAGGSLRCCVAEIF